MKFSGDAGGITLAPCVRFIRISKGKGKVHAAGRDSVPFGATVFYVTRMAFAPMENRGSGL